MGADRSGDERYQLLHHDLGPDRPIRMWRDEWDRVGPGLSDLHYEVELGIVDEKILALLPDITPDMDPMARKSYEEQSEHSGYGAAYGGHYDQFVRVKGALTVHGRAFTIDYVECMDRSWGVRPEVGLQPMAWHNAVTEGRKPPGKI